jgi:hypothetical protein
MGAIVPHLGMHFIAMKSLLLAKMCLSHTLRIDASPVTSLFQ